MGNFVVTANCYPANQNNHGLRLSTSLQRKSLSSPSKAILHVSVPSRLVSWYGTRYGSQRRPCLLTAAHLDLLQTYLACAQNQVFNTVVTTSSVHVYELVDSKHPYKADADMRSQHKWPVLNTENMQFIDSALPIFAILTTVIRSSCWSFVRPEPHDAIPDIKTRCNRKWCPSHFASMTQTAFKHERLPFMAKQ